MNDNQQPPVPTQALWDKIVSVAPELRNVISFTCGIAVAAGVMNSASQATIMDAVTHIGADVADIAKYLGIIGGIVMPILARNSSTVENLIRSLYKKAPAVKVVAPPPIAAVTPAESSRDVAVVSKVSGQELPTGKS